MHNAPMVESGETSTRCPPMFIEVAIAIGSAPSRAAKPGTVGRNAGSTTPDVLLYTEIAPVRKAMNPVMVPLVEKRASRSVNKAMPCVFSSKPVRMLTPQTITITDHGIFLIASLVSPAFAKDRITAPAKAPIPTFTLRKITESTRAAITDAVKTFLQ